MRLSKYKKASQKLRSFFTRSRNDTITPAHPLTDIPHLSTPNASTSSLQATENPHINTEYSLRPMKIEDKEQVVAFGERLWGHVLGKRPFQSIPFEEFFNPLHSALPTERNDACTYADDTFRYVMTTRNPSSIESVVGMIAACHKRACARKDFETNENSDSQSITSLLSNDDFLLHL